MTGELDEVVLEAELVPEGKEKADSKAYLVGTSNLKLKMREHLGCRPRPCPPGLSRASPIEAWGSRGWWPTWGRARGHSRWASSASHPAPSSSSSSSLFIPFLVTDGGCWDRLSCDDKSTKAIAALRASIAEFPELFPGYPGKDPTFGLSW